MLAIDKLDSTKPKKQNKYHCRTICIFFLNFAGIDQISGACQTVMLVI